MISNSAGYAVKYWSKALFIDALVFGALWLWQVHGLEGAGNVFLFATWSVTIVTLLAGMVMTKTDFEKTPRPPGFVVWHFVSEVLLLAGMVWVGLIFLSIVRLLAVLMLEAARDREPKVKPA